MIEEAVRKRAGTDAGAGALSKGFKLDEDA